MSKVAEARVIVTCPGRNFVTLKLTTDEGISTTAPTGGGAR
jgi:mannonate dehydratase